jgi:hypothetical protein
MRKAITALMAMPALVSANNVEDFIPDVEVGAVVSLKADCGIEGDGDCVLKPFRSVDRPRLNIKGERQYCGEPLKGMHCEKVALLELLTLKTIT